MKATRRDPTPFEEQKRTSQIMAIVWPLTICQRSRGLLPFRLAQGATIPVVCQPRLTIPSGQNVYPPDKTIHASTH